jgi:flagellar basal-body rod protein FlgB
MDGPFDQGGSVSSIKVFDRTLEALTKSLDLRSQRQVVISSNIANADTPGYQAQELDFEGALSRALTLDGKPIDRTDAKHMTASGEVGDITGEIHNEVNNVVREDGNTVDRDAELTSMAENELLYNAAADLVKKKLALLKYAISDGGSH